MKRLISCILVFILIVGTVSIFADDNDIVEYKDTQYTLSPWTFWQTGVTTDTWNQWELCAYKKVEMRDNVDEICVFSDSTPDMNPRIYEGI